MSVSFNSAADSRFLLNFVDRKTKRELKVMGVGIALCSFAFLLVDVVSNLFYVYSQERYPAVYEIPEPIEIEEPVEIQADNDDLIIQSMIDISCNSITSEKASLILSLVREHSAIYGFNVTTVLAVIAQESNYISSARSKADARGLMQVTPIALKDFNRYHNTSYTESDLYNDGINIMIGCWTLDRQKTYIGTDNLASCIISYNSGASNFKNNKSNYLDKYSYLEKVQYYEQMFMNLRS